MTFSSLRQSLRSLAANRAFSLAAIATLALGIGANAAIFSVVNGLLLKPLPYPDGERLVEVYNSYPTSGLDYAGSSIPDYLDRRQAPGLEDLALYTSGSVNIADESGPARLVAVRATPSLFTTLRVQPALGRPFTEDEARIGADKVVVLSHTTWQTHYAGDPAIIGRDVRLNDEPYRVIGVMPEGFAFPDRETGLWTPFAFTEEQRSDNERGNEFSASIGRLKPGATITELDAQFAAMVAAAADRLATTEDGAERAAFIRGGGFAGHAKSLREQWVGQMKPVLLLLQSVVVVVLLIACANVANLFLTRLSARRRELSVRAALGADRWRLARQLLGEALLLAMIGGLAGVLLAYFSQGFLHLLGLDRTLLGDRIGIDATVLWFTFGVALATGLLFGTVPALGQDGLRASEVLRESGRGGGSRVGQRLRSALVVVQIALAVCLLVGAGLLLRSFDRVHQQDPGFDRQGVVSVRMALPRSRYADAPAQTAFYQRLGAELRAVPGVREVGFISNLPFSNSNWTASYEIVGREVPAGSPGPHGYLHVADAGYFKAMGIPLLRGRLFDERDRADGARVVVIDQYLADRHFPNGDALGQRLELPGIGGADEVEGEIIGIVGTVKRGQLSEQVTKETYFLALSQYGSSGAMAVLKTDLDAAATLRPIQAALARVDPLQPVFDLKSLDARITLSLEGRMAPLVLLVIFAGVALLLAAVGIYGVLAFAVQQRTGEIGVRLAIGASPRDVQRLVMRQGMRLAGIGLVAGAIGALMGGRLLESQLFGVDSSDPLTLLVVLLTLGAAALLACYMPARRATRVAPLTALRSE
jgi:predicted permease